MSEAVIRVEGASEPAKPVLASPYPGVASLPHLFSIWLAVATLPLLFMGGLVTSTGAGMSVPDWPQSFGHNMFALPFDLWKGPVFTEHSHRLLGATVGFLAIGTLLACLRFGRSRGVKLLALGVLLLVCAQGVLGGMRVRLVEHGLAPVHGCFAQAVFAFMAALVTVTGQGWRESKPAAVAAPVLRRLRTLAIALVGLAYVQVLLGAWYRHYAGSRIEPHALNALAILALAIVLVRRMKRALPGRPWLAASGKQLHALLGTQILLGIASLVAKPRDVNVDVKLGLVSLHIVVGALLLGAAVALLLKLLRDAVPASAGAGIPAASEATLAGGTA